MKILRFNQTERLFHWAFAIPVLLLAASGSMMVIASIGIIAISKETILFYHIRLGFTLLSLPTLVYLLGDTATIRQNISEFINFSANDRHWLAMNFISLIKSEVALPPEGKFNGGQKINAMLMMGLTLTLCLSGLTMLAMKGALVANIFHVFAFALFAMLFPGHLYLATMNPSTRPAFMGIIKGYVESAWLKHHHILMFEKLEKTTFGDVVVESAKKNELKTIYNKVYKSKLSFDDFSKLCSLSEAMLVARKNDTPIAFMQVVGDGHLHGYIAQADIFVALTDAEDFFSKFTTAAEAVIGHSLSRPISPCKYSGNTRK